METDARRVSVKYNSQRPTPRSSSSSENAHDAEIKFQMICIDYRKGFQTEMHSCNVLWIKSLLERDWLETEELFARDDAI